MLYAMLFASREVRIGKNCAQGLEYLGRQITCLFLSLWKITL